jgi:hypothetical protein
MTLAAAIAFLITSTYPDLRSVETMARLSVDPTQDLVVAIGAPQKPGHAGSGVWWSPTTKLFLILQNRITDAPPVAIAAIEGDPDCAAQIARLRQTDLILACEGESGVPPWHKFAYGLKARKLLSHEKFQPFGFHKVVATAQAAVFVGDKLSVEYVPGREPPFRVIRRADVSGPPHAVPPSHIALPRSTYPEFARLRPGRVKNGYGPKSEIHEEVGPWVREAGRIWFGKTFYDGEGTTGIGGFGYLDERTKEVKLYSPPEVVNYSVSAISVAADDVWIGVTTRGEGTWSGGHLLHFDRATEQTRTVPFNDYVSGIARLGDQVVTAGSLSLGVTTGGHVERFFVDTIGEGHYRVLAFDPR